ncbi:uncharacterized protein LOC124619992 [Schistocerca americana]|uniref:uncharacterized protein LOC124619992 n=1 Tax=Schistocerca americana TaxID=7009 RepID=UPI001F4F9423|nr:uncharacterized protein LOC124619992 [Schistocerca americana]
MTRRRAHVYRCRWTLLAFFLLQTKGSYGRGVFSPRVDYDEWTPLGRGDPLKNDPTYDYVPPVLDRVHYWLEPASRTPDPPLATTPQPEVPVLRPRQPTPLPPPVATTADAAPPTAPQSSQAQLESRRDVFDQFLKIVDASKFGSNHHYSSLPASYYPSPFYHKPSAPPMRPPYTMLMPPPPPPPTASALARPTQGQTSVSLQHANLVYHASTTQPLQQALDWKEGKTQLATVAAAPPTAAAPTRPPAAHDAVDLSSLLQSLLRDEATPVTAVAPQSDAFTVTTPPATPTTTVTTCATPVATTVASLTTDPLFSHYKQPAEPLRGPMYLIIQGHSKVKTYGAANKHQHSYHGIPIQNSNDIQQEQDMETDRSGRAVDDEVYSVASSYESNTIGTGQDDTLRRTPRSSTEYVNDVFDDTGPSKPARARRKKRAADDISDELKPPSATTSDQDDVPRVATQPKVLQRSGKANPKKVTSITSRADIYRKRRLKGMKTFRRVHSAVEATTREIEAILKQNRQMSKQLQNLPGYQWRSSGLKAAAAPENVMAEATVQEIEAILRENREMSRQFGTLPGYATQSGTTSLIEIPLRRSGTISSKEKPQTETIRSHRNKRQLLEVPEEHPGVTTDDASAATENATTYDDSDGHDEQLLRYNSAKPESEVTTEIEPAPIGPDSQLTMQQEQWTTPETVISPTRTVINDDKEVESSKGRQVLEELGELIPLDEDTAEELLQGLLVQQGQGSGAGAVIASSLAKILDVESRT